MSPLLFLDGKVTTETLPVFTGPPGAEAPMLKRLLLPQGELTQFYDAEAAVRYLALIELKAGAIRGNHYHQVKEEQLYVVQGELQLIVEDVVTRIRQIVPLRAGEKAFIHPGVAHALKTVVPGCAVEFAGTRFDAADTHRYPLT